MSRLSASKKRFRVETVAPKGDFDQRSFRTVKMGDHYITVGCPRGRWSHSKKSCKVGTRAQRILHPIGEKNPCPLKKAAKETREWRWGMNPDEIVKVKKPKIGRFATVLGEVPYFDYDARKGSGVKKRYLHNFKKKAIAISQKNANWILITGNFKVKPAGVTG